MKDTGQPLAVGDMAFLPLRAEPGHPLHRLSQPITSTAGRVVAIADGWATVDRGPWGQFGCPVEDLRRAETSELDDDATGVTDWLRRQLDVDDLLASAMDRVTYHTLFAVTTDVGPLHGTRFCLDGPSLRREVLAKRRRLDLHVPRVFDGGRAECRRCIGTGDGGWPCLELSLDLAVYAGRPGYRAAWRP
jgi:hypothetical protein